MSGAIPALAGAIVAACSKVKASVVIDFVKDVRNG